MNTVRRLVVLGIAVVFITAVSVPLFSQDDQQQPVEEASTAPAPSNPSTPDPPSRAARLDYMSGSVSVQPGGVNDWVEASINRTLTTSDRIWADKNSRAELQLDTAAIRINSESSVTLTNVSDTSTQIELDQGTMYLSVSRLFPGQIYEVDTPNVAFTVLKPGRYRFDVDSTGDNTRVLVHRGEGEATGDGPSVRIREREGARFSGGRSMAHNLFEDPGYDGFDDWAATRDKRQEESVSARYVAPGVVGYEDLDSYGYWRTFAPYGPVWVPTAVAPGWAPYRFGHWAWVAPWGWTWVDDAPWGYAPFHYGRWAYIHGNWGWLPGPVYVRPVWAPALVAWVGGAHFGVGFGVGGGYGWFPLGYREPFVPWYGGSRRYFRNVNVSNTNITNITYVTNNYYNNPRNINRITYVNRTVPGAMTAVPASTLVNGRSVQRTAVRVNPNELRGATVMARPNLRPTTNAVLGPHAGVRTNAPPAAVMNRRVVTKMAPPAPRQPMRGAVTEANRPGQAGFNAPRGGATGTPGQTGMNVGKPGMNNPGSATPAMNTVARPGAPANNNAVGKPMMNTEAGPGNRPSMVNDNKPQYPSNVHRPPSTGGAVARPGNANAGNSGQFNRAPVNNGTMNRNVQLNPNVPRPGEMGGRPNTAVSPATPVQRPAVNVQPPPKPQAPTVSTQPRDGVNNVNNNVPRPSAGAGYSNPNAGVNTRVNPSGNVSSGRSYPQGNSGGTRVYQPANNSGGRVSAQPKGNQQKSTPKNEDKPKDRPQGYLSPGTSSPTMNAGARSSYSFPRPQPGQVRQPQSAAAQSSSYGRPAQSTYSRASSGSYGVTRSSGQYSSPQYSNRASANGSYGYSNRSVGSSGSYSRGNASMGTYSQGGTRGASSAPSSRGGSYSKSSGGAGHSSGGGHSHGR